MNKNKAILFALFLSVGLNVFLVLRSFNIFSNPLDEFVLTENSAEVLELVLEDLNEEEQSRLKNAYSTFHTLYPTTKGKMWISITYYKPPEQVKFKDLLEEQI